MSIAIMGQDNRIMSMPGSVGMAVACLGASRYYDPKARIVKADPDGPGWVDVPEADIKKAKADQERWEARRWRGQQ